jgi:hypothetical protein
MSYLLDANVFIQAKNLHYGFDFCPAFWDWLIENNNAGLVFSIEKVSDELAAGNDDLAPWAEARGAAFFLAPDTQTAGEFANVSNWVTSQNYEPAAITTFLQIADYYLIAHALAHQFTIVTHEVAANTTKKVKIPNVCIGLGIDCKTPYDMLRRERARFVLGRL